MVHTLLRGIDFLRNFPGTQYSSILPNQQRSLEIIKENGSVTLELPTGSGKTLIGYLFLKALEVAGRRPLFYIVPNKALVDQVHKLHPDVKIAYGKNEHPCVYFKDKNLMADQVPCSLINCPHRVDQETGRTTVDNVEPCSYYQQKYEAKQGGIVVSTIAFYLFTQLFSKEWEKPAGLVIDEVHNLASLIRGPLSYEITDFNLRRAIEVLSDIEGTEKETRALKGFLRRLIRIIKEKPVGRPTLFEPEEIKDLLKRLTVIDPEELKNKIHSGIKNGEVDIQEQSETLKRLEVIAFNLNRYIRSFEFSLSTRDREPLNYTYGYFEREINPPKRVQYRLVVKAYYVAPIIKRLLSPLTVAYSATIGDPGVLGFETGIRNSFFSLGSDFPFQNTRIFMPQDTPNLAVKKKSRQQPTKVLRKIARYCRELRESGLRSLVIVVSNKELNKFLMLCEEESVEAVSYGSNGKWSSARQAVSAFKQGQGDVLAGTCVHYGQGIDLPKNLAPVIFFLRPAYPNPSDPNTVFELRRFRSSAVWKLWNWRVMIEALQVRGRNIRSKTDRGVTFFVSQQFRRFVFASLPEWLQKSYEGKENFRTCIEKTRDLLVD